jgi:hypothetical protein
MDEFRWFETTCSSSPEPAEIEVRVRSPQAECSRLKSSAKGDLNSFAAGCLMRAAALLADSSVGLAATGDKRR